MANTSPAARRHLSYTTLLDVLPADYIARQAARKAAQVRAKIAEREAMRGLAERPTLRHLDAMLSEESK